MKTLSVIMGLYNSADYMPRCIESLVHQDIPLDELEILLINDCSPDNSLEVANLYANKYPQCIKVISHDVNKGLAGARNTGLDNATGKYVTFTDPDDYVLTNSVKQLIDKMELDRLDVLRFDYFYVDENGCEIPKPKKASIIDYSECIMTGQQFLSKRLGFGCFVWPFFYRLDVIRNFNIRFVNGLYYDDTEWLPKVLCASGRVGCVPVKRIFYVQRDGSLTHVVDPKKLTRMSYALFDVVDVLITDSKSYSDPDVTRWYKSMISFVVLTLLSSSIKLDCYFDVVKQVKSRKYFPLFTDDFTITAKIKMIIFAFSPRLFRFVLRIR